MGRVNDLTAHGYSRRPAHVRLGENILWQMWHREQGGLFLPSHPNCIHSMQVRVQLNDTDATGHTFSTVPESVAAKRRLPWVPQLDKDGKPTVLAQVRNEPSWPRSWANSSTL